MKYFGDPITRCDFKIAFAKLQSWIRESPSQAQALKVLIETGKLIQGLLDREMSFTATDDWGPLENACSRTALFAARFWSTSGAIGNRNELLESLNFLQQLCLEKQNSIDQLNLKTPEGYAFYCLHPLQYYLAAKNLGPQPVTVIGIRSIGTSLGAVFVRPVGDPFDRQLKISERLKNKLLSGSPCSRFAIVDEGPGLSGSSFGSVADWLEDLGVERDRIVFFPSHPGEPGPRSSRRHKFRWSNTTRLLVPFSPQWVGLPSDCEDLGGGLWRQHQSRAAWIPAARLTEKRKYLFCDRTGERVFAKFAGFGVEGEMKYKRSLALSETGITPRTIELRHGYILEPWIENSRPVSLSRSCSKPEDRNALLCTAAALIRKSTATSSFQNTFGASPSELHQMMLRNTLLGIGPDVLWKVEKWRDRLKRLTELSRPVPVDARLHAWEWLKTAEGLLVKTDGWDHFYSHEFIGCQDRTWDIAGAIVEFDLTKAERKSFLSQITGCNEPIDHELLNFNQLAYLAFQGGSFTLAADFESDPNEADLLRKLASQYFDKLQRQL